MYVVILIVILIIIIYNISYTSTIDHYSADPSILKLENIYQRRLNEMNNIDTVLERPIVPGDKYINNLQLMPLYVNDHAVNNTSTTVPYSKPIAISDNLMKLIKPRMMKRTKLIYNNNEIFYYDKIFQEQPTNINFAINPKKYVLENPVTYPSYLVLKNNDYFMEIQEKIPL